MARIELQEVAHSYTAHPGTPSDYALKHVHTAWEDGGAYALLGPSGCGKTTLLNIISGLLSPSRGRVVYDGRDVTGLRPEKRNIAQVFQFPVLYDTMSVYDNLAFPLKNRGMPKQEIQRRVRDVAGMLDLAPFLDRKAAGLTADAKQKISLGRGLVRRDVAAILFDEPLTVIDPQLKWHLRRKLKEIHDQLKLTLIYVTHDQVEALTFADKVMVMVEGEMVQTGTPQELFEHPEHKFVGYFIGSPGMNFLTCTIDGAMARVGGAAVPLHDELTRRAARATGRLELGIRPMYLEVHDTAGQDRVPARVTSVEDQGNCMVVSAQLGDQVVKARVPEGTGIPTENLWLRFPRKWTRVYADGRLVSSPTKTGA